MQPAFRERLFQRWAPVHQRCAPSPARYPGFSCPFSEEDRLDQCISGYPFSIEVGGDSSSSVNMTEWQLCAAGMFSSRSTTTDTLAIHERGANCHHSIQQGEKMQPPTSRYTHRPLRERLEDLRRSAKCDIHTQRTDQTNRLSGPIKAWCEDMSPDQRSRRFKLEEIARLAGLVGKHGGQAAHHHIAQALRSIGFSPSRDWSVAGRNKRYWKLQGDTK